MNEEQRGSAIIGEIFRLLDKDPAASTLSARIKETLGITFLAGLLRDEPDVRRRGDLLQRFIEDLKNGVDDLTRLESAKSAEEFEAALREVWLREVGRLPPDDKRSLH